MTNISTKKTVTAFFKDAKTVKGVREEDITVLSAELVKYAPINLRIADAKKIWAAGAAKSGMDDGEIEPVITIDGVLCIVFFEDAYDQDAVRVFISSDYNWNLAKPAGTNIDLLSILLPRDIVVDNKLTNLMKMIEEGDNRKALTIAKDAVEKMIKKNTPTKRKTPAVVKNKIPAKE